MIAIDKGTPSITMLLACLYLGACGGGGGGGGGGGQSLHGSISTPFPVAAENEFPPGTRINVSAQNLFPMSAGDVWNYTRLDGTGVQTGNLSQTVTSGPDGSGRVTLSVSDASGSSTVNAIVNIDGVLELDPLGGAVPPKAAGIIGSILEYATPLYAQGEQRRHVRSGPWGEDLDGDGVDESFASNLPKYSLDSSRFSYPSPRT